MIKRVSLASLAVAVTLVALPASSYAGDRSSCLGLDRVGQDMTRIFDGMRKDLRTMGDALMPTRDHKRYCLLCDRDHARRS